MDLGEYHARFYVHSQWVFADLKSFGGEHDLLALLTTAVKSGDVVYDIGANMGLHTVFLGQAVGARGLVLAFEPEVHLCERLRANAALNGLKNVRIIPLALGDHSYTSGFLPSERGTAATGWRTSRRRELVSNLCRRFALFKETSSWRGNNFLCRDW